PAGSDSPPDQRPAEDPALIPTLLPSDFSGNADYILKQNGRVVRTSDGATLKGPGPGDWLDGGGNALWNFAPGNRLWKTTTDSILGGTYYSEVNISVPSSPGTGGPPIPLTLIAEGWVDISGNPEMEPALTLEGKGYAAIAGYDLKIGGNPVNAYKGVFYAGHQIGFSGNPEIVGQVIAASQDDKKFQGTNNLIKLDSDGFMEISGNATITYDRLGAIVKLKVGGWRECRGADPANPCG
ncbi:hypothetical protein MYX65_10220, partial [Acidobacteria bacterium AH-259-L09]|nr:hypothetical protein [Acidobacteria bacterium AH-259-L09]